MTEQHAHVPTHQVTETEFRGTASGTENGKLYWHWVWWTCHCGHGPMNKEVEGTTVINAD